MLKGRRRIYLATLLVFFVYAAWLIGPFVYSTIVRDASVTTWIRRSVAPIDGQIVTELPPVGTVIGPDGHVATIRNDRLFEAAATLEEEREHTAILRAERDQASLYLDEIRALRDARATVEDRLAQVFREEIETDIRHLVRESEANGRRIEVLQRIADRQQSLIERRAGSASELDEILVRLVEAESRQTELRGALEHARLRRDAAGEGVFITEGGSSPDWRWEGDVLVEVELRRARTEVTAATAALEVAERDLANLERSFERLRQAPATAQPGALVFSILAAPHARVSAGHPMIAWIDCSSLLVDVPVSDAVIPLIEANQQAVVTLEGESETRVARVLMTRGAAATLTSTDLAAVAKGRSEGVAQVLLTLEDQRPDFADCPVGRAAYVRFPDIGLLDVVRARLRLPQ